MAVKLRDYYQHYYSVVAAQYFLAQLVIFLIAGSASWAIWQYSALTPEFMFFASVITFVLMELVFMPVLLKTISDPVRVIVQAIAHVSSEGGHTPAPTINTAHYERTGLHTVVKNIYELSTNSEQPAAADALPTTLSAPALLDLVKSMPGGLVTLRTDHSIDFFNPAAPVRIDNNEKPQLELLFEPSDDLETWLKKCEATKVHDTKVWRRVANKLPESEGLRIFDVIGYYNKKGDTEAILLIIDRTTDYAPDQEDMDFIALAAHELRGPITVIRGYLDVLGEELAPVLQDDQKQLIERLSVSANRLSGYVNNILNVSRYDRKHLKLHLHEDKLPDILRSLVDDLEMRARTQNRLLGFTVPEDLPTIAADRTSLSEVISNLVDNAIKYSHEGGQVVVSARVKGNFVEMTVQDFGIGIPGSVVGNLFSKFYRSHRSRQTVGGTGLGLFISKVIIESHGGGIWVSSNEGQGSIFGFTVPIYATVADKLKKSNNGNEGIIENASGWIRNHSTMYRR